MFVFVIEAKNSFSGQILSYFLFINLCCQIYVPLYRAVLILWTAFLIQMGNKGAFIRYTAPEMKPDIVTFSAVVSSSLFFRLC